MPPSKHGLGKGLGALIPPGMPTALAPGIREVEVTRIEPNPRQPRHSLDRAALQELAASIKEHGVIQPLVVTPAPDSTDAAPRYQLIAGERRWQAAILAGLAQVPIIVRGATPQEMLELALVENIQRADLNPLEEAQAFRQLMDDFGLTQEQVADKVGKDRTTVANALRLLKLPEELKRAVLDEKISEGHARALLMLPDEKLQVSLLATLIAKGLSVRETEELVRRALTKPKPTRASASRAEHAMPAATRALEEEFRKALGTKVQVFRSRRGGKIVVHFYSEEELEAVYQKIVKR